MPIGLLCNGTHLRLLYAPRGETAGHLTFPVRAMTEVAGRPIFAALYMLLCAPRLFTLPDKQRLPTILAESRKYQNTVSTELAKQVLAALYELLRGFQSANDQRKGDLLRDVLAADPDQVYGGLLTVLMRLVFLLYAEDRGLMSDDEVYVKHYGVIGLFERLRADAGRYPDTMDLRYGAWAQLLALFRLVHDGGQHGALHLPARHGYLFNPDRYPFLEGRPLGSQRQHGERLTPPLVADGVVFRVLHNLLVLDGERISYRTLDVEQIGSVYETMMGFRLEKAQGRSIAIKPVKPHGAPVTINLEALLQTPGKDRGKWLKEQTDQTVTGAALNALKSADSLEGLVAALGRKVASDLTPNIVPPGGMALQPSAERRRSGSHYTPRSLTEPIVRKALEPVLKQLGERPTPAQLLSLKVCDPAMGSGAFLVELCRQLGDALVTAWRVHDCLPAIPPDEDEVLHARRVVAQRCLYGVDKNEAAVALAKLSLWLATLAKDHPFTFLDHALRCGDSLVGLGKDEIRRFHWKPGYQQQIGESYKLEERLRLVTQRRQEILEGGDYLTPLQKAEKLALAEESLGLIRFAGNLVIAAFFAGENERQRQSARDDLLTQLTAYMNGDLLARPTSAEEKLRAGDKGITPFHWEIEFPEVFGRETRGFDCIVGNPPFMGGGKISTVSGNAYLDWLKMGHPESHGNADLVAHFFRRVFNQLRLGGTFGLIATNTIAQGDTRSTGLRWICTQGGTIYAARRRYKWPGQAAVVVSVVHISKGSLSAPYELDGKPVALITAYLFHAGGHDNPGTLKANAGKNSNGVKIYGGGFTFDDDDLDGVSSPMTLMHALVAKDGANRQRIYPYIGGEEINDDPVHNHRRFVINFEEMTLQEASNWPELLKIVENRVKPARDRLGEGDCKSNWWQFERPRTDFISKIRIMGQYLACSRLQHHWALCFLAPAVLCSDAVVVFALESNAAFCTLQCRVHELWARFFGSSMKDDLRYTPSDCFETFPFPVKFESHPQLEAAGKAYYEFRAALMVGNNEGLTKTYNRFHDPNERSADILRLRELHAQMDRAVLDAYGWTDLTPTCAFLLDYEEDEDEETTGRQRKKPWRYRWPDDFRDEVLARLLELNKQRAEQEALAGPAEQPKKPRARRSQSNNEQPRLF